MTRRLMLWLTGATVCFWFAAAIVGGLVMRDEFDEVFDSAVQETAQRLMPLVIDDLYQRGDGAGVQRIGAAAEDEDEHLTYQVRDAEGRIVMHSHDAPTEPFDAPLREGFWQAPEHRIYTAAALSGTLFLQVADPLAHRREAMLEGMLSLVLPVLFLAPLSMLAIWYLVRRSLAPIGVLRREIGRRDGANLASLRMSGLPVELEGIATSVDRLLDRLRLAIDAEREFASNSAHELRTPIAGALAQVQRLIAELPGGPARQRAADVEGSLEGLAHLAEKLLQLARADSGIGLATMPVDIVPVLKLVAEEFSRRPANDGRIRIDVQPAELRRGVDIDALAIVLRNLVENALLHGSQAEPVEIACDADGRIAVRNGGPVVPPETLAQLTQRFRRGATPASGSGLGLAIASRLVGQMGGTLELRSPATGRRDGFEAILSIP